MNEIADIIREMDAAVTVVAGDCTNLRDSSW
jgi:hypothetical protein